MTVKLVNMTNTANIYGVYENDNRIGTIEIKLVGPYCGTYARTCSGRYTNRDIKKFFNAYRKEANK